MGLYLVTYSDDVRKQFQAIKKSGDKGVMNKITRLLVELSDHPMVGTGRPEQLKHELQGLWSRRIDRKNRLVYQIVEEEQVVHLVQLIGHYSDK